MWLISVFASLISKSGSLDTYSAEYISNTAGTSDSYCGAGLGAVAAGLVLALYVGPCHHHGGSLEQLGANQKAAIAF